MTTRKSISAPALSRRTLIRSGAAMAALATLPGKSRESKTEDTMDTITQAEAALQTRSAADKSAVRPFPITPVCPYL